MRIRNQLFVLGPADPIPVWFHRAITSPSVRWRIGGTLFVGRAEVVSDSVLIRGTIHPRFEESFGSNVVRGWFGAEPVCLALTPTAEPQQDYYTQLESLFDEIAPAYDRIVESNPLDRLLRQSSLAMMRTTFRSGERVLEIGCGTGLETIPLAASGIKMVAMDISQGMLDRLEMKASAAGLSNRITPRKARASDLGDILREYGPASFDGIVSTFGAMNSEPRWDELPPIMAELVRPGGRLVLGVWNRTCGLEMALYALRLRPRRVLARLRSPVPANLSRFGIPVHAKSPRDCLTRLEPYFETEVLVGLPVVLPPYDFISHIPSAGVLVPWLAAIDRRLGPRFPFNRLGDHFLLKSRRRGGQAGSTRRWMRAKGFKPQERLRSK